MDLRDSTTKVLLALSYVEELGYKKKATLLERISDINRIPEEQSTVKYVLGEANSAEFFNRYAEVDSIIENLVQNDIHWLSFLDDDYPDSLRGIVDRPIFLFVKGNCSALRKDCIAIVGSRRATRYGEKVAEDFARAFACAGVTVVSGFARGIDGITHKACVASESPTVAVFACGLDVCYPAEHKGLMNAILMSGGALVSEYPLGTKPLQYHFPERNRIISGLSRGVLLAQAAKKSGSLITMRFAVEQGKEIFAVPGNIYSAEYEGSNELLREMPHALAISPEDVLDSLGIKRERAEVQAVELSLAENMIVEALRDEEKHFEELLAQTELGVSELTNVLFNLELNGIVHNTGGNYYSLTGE